jgi:hypothetical protein
MQKLTIFLFGIFILTTSLPAARNATSQNAESLALRCFEKPFIGVSVRARGRDVVPAVNLSLTDPLGRRQGEGSRDPQIPTSSYGIVVQIPKLPDRSRVRAIEVCDPEPGVYGLKLEEHGDEFYVLDVTAQAPNAGIVASLLLYHIATEGRIGHYRFTSKIAKEKVDIRWLDQADHEQTRIEINEW